MKTNKLSESNRNDFEAADQHLRQHSKRSSADYMTYDNEEQTGFASNDASYESELSELMAAAIANAKGNQNTSATGAPYVEQPIKVDGSYKRADSFNVAGFKKGITQPIDKSKAIKSPLDTDSIYSPSKSHLDALLEPVNEPASVKQPPTVSERVFMNSLIKHTGIALAIIIPLAAFSAFAGAANVANISVATNKATTATIDIEPSLIVHKSATTPTTVDSVDLQQYAGTWYEIARLPMYFQRNCASDVTATYTSKTDNSGIIVTNKCKDNDGADIVAEGLAKPADETGSKLKVTFLPSWIRWLPVGRADYWVLARDTDYQTALVGTPDKDYLWLLARTPNISQQTYSKYRQIAQQQGYDLREFTLTAQADQTVNLLP